MTGRRDLDLAAQKLYHEQTRAWSGVAWEWTKADEEVKEKFRAHVLAGTRPPLPTDK